MLSSDSSLNSLRAAGTKGVEIVVSFLAQRWALPLTDGVGDWDPSNCGMPVRELSLVQTIVQLPYTQVYLDIDECLTEQYICPPTLDCLNTLGSYRCVVTCGGGFKRSENGQNCQGEVNDLYLFGHE